MSVYSVKGKGWRYDFTLRGQRYTEAWFKTKREANAAEHKRREELNRPTSWTPTDMPFLELVNLRLDHVKAYHSGLYYQEHVYMARRWVKAWGKLNAMSITRDMVERFILHRGKVSAITANKEIRYLRATFNFGKKRNLVQVNPVDGIGFLPVDKRIKTVPSAEDIEKVLTVADLETRDYLITVRDTLARISEINGLTWDDVDLEGRFVVLYTRKKKGGHRTPRKVPMTARLFEVMTRRYKARDKSKPWVFWHRYVSSKTGQAIEGTVSGSQAADAWALPKGRRALFPVPCPTACRGVAPGQRQRAYRGDSAHTRP